MNDDRYQKIMADLGTPNSRSLLSALQQVANEAAQAAQAATRERFRSLLIDYATACGELSKGLCADDPMWVELRALGARLDSLAMTNQGDGTTPPARLAAREATTAAFCPFCGTKAA